MPLQERLLKKIRFVCRLIEFALAVPKLLMFKICGITGISKIEFFNFFCTEMLNDLSNKVCFLNKIKYLNLSISSMITGINESKISTKHISCESKCKCDDRKFISNQKWNNDKCRCECKNLKENCV